MAKGNLFQGMGRGKIGDVVFSRLNGQQVSRVRNRNPKNPRSNAQLYQRAIMATIMQAYSAGKKIFDHSFQGVSVGAANMAVFMRENLKILRQQLAYEFNNRGLAEDMKANCVWPGANQPVANAYLISKGTYKQKAFAETRPGGGVYYTLPEPEANEKVNEYAARVGLLADDYYTFCVFLEGTNELFHAFEGLEDPAGIGYDCRFGYVRLHVKSNVASIEDAIATKSQLFDVDASMNIDDAFMTENVAEGISISDLDITSRGVGSIGLIRSRKDRDLRSTSYMDCPTKSQLEYNDFGIKVIYLDEAWKRATESLGNSDLILEGGGAKPTPTPTPVSYFLQKCNDASSAMWGKYFPILRMSDGSKKVACIGLPPTEDIDHTFVNQGALPTASSQNPENLTEVWLQTGERTGGVWLDGAYDIANDSDNDFKYDLEEAGVDYTNEANFPNIVELTGLTFENGKATVANSVIVNVLPEYIPE